MRVPMTVASKLQGRVLMGRPRKRPGELGVIHPKRTASGKWRVRIRVRDGAGKLHVIDVLAATEEAAVERAKSRAHAAWNGMVVLLDDQATIADLGTVWLQDVRESFRQQSTIESYESIVRSVIVPQIGAFVLADLNAGVFDRMLKKIAAEKSANYARSAKRVMSVMLRYGIQHGAVRTNFIRDVDPIRSDPTVHLDLELDQAVGLLFLIRQWRGENPDRRGGGVPDVQLLEDLILLMLGTSMRPGEALALRRQDVIVGGDRWKVRVEGTVSTTRKHGTIRKPQPKRERQKRTINVPEFTAAVLRRRLATYVDNPDDLLFPTRKGTVRQTHNLNRMLRSFREAYREELTDMGMDVDRLTSRLFRKAAATTVFTQVNGEAARLLLGHARLETTMIYVKEDDEVPAITAEALEARYPLGR
jgi:integrase